MKVLLVSADFPPVQSGEANHAYYIAHHLARLGLDVHVLTSRIEGIRSAPGLSVHAIMRTWSWFELWKFASFVRRSSPDAILLIFLGSMYGHHPMITFAATVVDAVRPSIRFVTQFEHLWMDGSGQHWRTRIVRKLMALWAGSAGVSYGYGTLLRDSDAVIVLSEMHLARLSGHFPLLADKTSLIPPPPIVKVCQEKALQRDEMRSGMGVEEGECLLVFYGYIYRGKGFDTLLRALRLLANRRIEARLLVIGGPFVNVTSPGETTRSKEYFVLVQELAAELGLGKRVIWSGATTGDSDRTSALLYAADVCVLPFDDGLHLNNSSFAVAAVHGLPIVSTRCPTTESVFRDQENVMLCSPQNPAELAEAIEAVVTCPKRRQTLVTGVQELANSWFSWEKAIQRMLETLEIESPMGNGENFTSIKERRTSPELVEP